MLTARFRAFRPQIVVDFRTRPARPGIAHLPEVVFFVQPENAALRHARHFLPQALGLVVFAENRDVEPVGGNPVDLRDQFPGEIDRFCLEIVAEREVPEHLEKRVVAARVADIFEVVMLATGPHALLGSGRTGVIALFQTLKNLLELVHPRVGEEEGRVVRRHE